MHVLLGENSPVGSASSQGPDDARESRGEFRMHKNGLLIIVAIFAVAGLCWAVGHEKTILDAKREEQQKQKDTAQQHHVELQIAEMAQRWKASTNWNRKTRIDSSLDPSKLESTLESYPDVVVLGRIDAIIEGPADGRYFITLTDVEDRLLVKLTCDPGQIAKFKDAAGVDRLYAQYAVVAKVNGVRRSEAASRTQTDSAGPLYDFVVEADSVDAMPLQFTNYTRLSDLKIPVA
jgi:hypothetical protein